METGSQTENSRVEIVTAGLGLKGKSQKVLPLEPGVGSLTEWVPQ